MRRRHHIFGNVALSVTRPNSLQKCVFCEKHMPKGSLGVVFRKGLSNQDVFVWCHHECFPKLSKKINKWLRDNQETINKLEEKILVEDI